MENSAQDIITLITQYTSELELLDQTNNNYIMTCLGIIGVILGAIVTLFSIRNSESSKIERNSIYKLISTLFMAIPLVSCIYIGVATIACRKAAIYRSYLVYLEQEYNKIPNVVPQKLNVQALDFLSKWSLDNTNGSMMNRLVVFAYIFVVGILFITCYIMGFAFLKKSTSHVDRKLTRVEFLMTIGFFLIIVACTLICTVSIIDLCINDVTVSKVLDYLQ